MQALISWDAAFLLKIGSFLPTFELLCQQLCLGALSLAIEAFLLTVGASLLTQQFVLHLDGGNSALLIGF